MLLDFLKLNMHDLTHIKKQPKYDGKDSKTKLKAQTLTDFNVSAAC